MQNVLLVDDEPLIRSVVSDVIRRYGLQVTACAGVNEAVELLQNTRFNLVLTDFQMADGSGETVVRAAQDFCPAATRAVMTGNIHLVPERVFAAVHQVLEKPFIYSAIAGLLLGLGFSESLPDVNFDMV